MKSIYLILLNVYLQLCLLLSYITGSKIEICWDNIDCAVVEIFQTCFGDNENLPIVVIGKNESTLKNLQQTSQVHQVALVDPKGSLYAPKEKLYLLRDYTVDAKPQPSTKFLFDEIEVTSLESAIRNVYNSVWWNLFGNFVFKNTLISNTCAHSYSYFKVVWKFDVLKATYLCRNSLDKIEFFTFNPFTNHISKPWKAVEIHRQGNNHPFTLFKLTQKFDVCHALNSDKTRSLDGYPISILVKLDPPFMTYDKMSGQFAGVSKAILEFIWAKLGASSRWILYPHASTGKRHENGSVDGQASRERQRRRASVTRTAASTGKRHENGSVDDLLAEVLRGNYDYALPYRPDVLLWRNQMYLYVKLTMCCATRKHILPARLKVQTLVDAKSLIAFACIFVSITLTLMYLSDKSFGRASLNFLRLALNMPTLSRPASHMGRLVFSLYLAAQIVLTNVQQGDLYSAITAPFYDRLVESEEDLLNFRYDIYSSEQPRHILSLDVYNWQTKVQVTANRPECFRHVEYDYRSACVDFCQAIPYFFNLGKRMQITQLDRYVNQYSVIVCRDDFGLHQRISSMVLRLQESYVIQYLIKSFQSQFYKKSNETMMEAEPLTSSHMSFAYVFIACGWFFSGVVWLIEVIYVFLKKTLF